MENFETVVIAGWALAAGYAIRESMQIHRDYKENMRRIDEAYELAKREAREECLLGDSFWSGFCHKCRNVHGPGECSSGHI